LVRVVEPHAPTDKSLLLLFFRKEGLALLIVFEGGEGAGKTSAMHALASTLDNPLLTREPGGTEEGLKLRALLLATDSPVWDPVAELLLLTAARVQHVNRVIRPALEAGRIVLCDRFIGSTLAYQGAGRGLDEAFILSLHRQAVGGLMPDLTILLDIDPRVGLARSARRLDAARSDEGKFEALDLAFHDRVRAAFLAQRLGKTIVVDASVSHAEVHSAVLMGQSQKAV